MFFFLFSSINPLYCLPLCVFYYFIFESSYSPLFLLCYYLLYATFFSYNHLFHFIIPPLSSLSSPFIPDFPFATRTFHTLPKAVSTNHFHSCSIHLHFSPIFSSCILLHISVLSVQEGDNGTTSQ